jgi:hypothetical protein
MSDVMVVVDKATWHAEQRDASREFAPGSILPWRSYETNNSLVAKYLESGDRLFLVTARGEHLWLVAVYEDVHLRSRKGNSFRWSTAHPNRVPIIDVTFLRPKLRFHTGNGLTKKPGMLGNSLQTPRLLTEGDIKLLEASIQTHSNAKIAPRRRLSLEMEAIEGELLVREVMLYRRDPGLALECVKRDRYTCRCCGFTVDKTRFPGLFERIAARIVQAHHCRPVSSGKRKVKVSDLLTLCPTCHVVAHAIANTEGAPLIDLRLLRRFYRP